MISAFRVVSFLAARAISRYSSTVMPAVAIQLFEPPKEEVENAA